MRHAGIKNWIRVVYTLVMVFVLVFGGTVNVNAQSTQTSNPQQDPVTNRWIYELSIMTPLANVQEQGGVEATGIRLTNLLSEKLSSFAVEQKLTGAEENQDVVLYQVSIQGNSSVDTLRKLLFEDLGSDFDFLYGPARVTIHGNLSKDQQMAFVFESRPTTGFAWKLAETNNGFVEENQPSEFKNTPGQIGGNSKQTIFVKALVDGITSIEFDYLQPWQADAPLVRDLDLFVETLPETLDLSSPVAQAFASPFAALDTTSTLANPGLVVDAVEAASLPSSFDWRAQGKVTPVRNQGGCGSCWAFGTVGSMESAILIKTGQSVDLSEQYLISCNVSNWSCNGGWWAHDLHTNVAGKYNNPPGAVLEAEKPYTATDGTCNQVYNHNYKLADWKYITGTWSITPTVDQLKAAIYNYGPVTASVCVAGGFSSYTSGVFSENNTCGGSPNHGIVLVGWDDATQSWILRNSWGSSWGDHGYMRIKWGVSLVGYGATYVVFNSPVNTPVPSISNLDPASIQAGSNSFTLTVNGTDFVAGSVVRWNGADLPTTYQSNFKLTAAISSDLIATAGDAVITVFNPAPGGGISNSVKFSVYNAAPPLPSNFRQVDATANSVTLGWDDSRVETGYHLYKWGLGSNGWDFYLHATLAANTTSYTETVEACGNDGYYKLTAFNDYGESGKTPFVHATTDSCNLVPGDDFDSAVVVSYNSGPVKFEQVVDTSQASKAWDDPILYSAQHEKTVWYSFTPISSGTLTVDTYTSTYDTVLGVWTGQRGNLKLVGSNNNSNGYQSYVRISVSAGITYYIETASIKPDAGTLRFHLSFTPSTLSNNSFLTPVIVKDLPAGVEYTKVQDVYRATTDSGDPAFPDGSGKNYHTVWYRYRPAVSGLMTVDTAGSDYDTLIGVWRGTSSVLSPMGWNDNSGSQLTSHLQMRLVGMTTYYIEVASKTANGPSKLNFHLSFEPGAPVSSGAYDDTAPELIFNGAWTAIEWPNATSGGLHTSNARYDTAGMTFYGQRVALEYSRMSSAGVLRVVIDGVTRVDINQKGSSFDHRMWTSGSLAGTGPHTIMVYHLSGGPVNLDSVKILTAPSLLGAGSYDDSDTNLDLRGFWLTKEAPLAEGGKLLLSPSIGDRITVRFTGNGVRLNYAKLPASGILKVTVDGVTVAYINQLSSTDVYGKTWTRALSNKEHVMTLSHYYGGAVNIDAVTILAP